MLQFQNVAKYYDNILALQIPELVIETGIWWLKGENGSGKTTFLKMIAGLHAFTGNIILENQFSLKKQRHSFVKSVNYSEAEPLYPPFITAEDLARLYCETKGGNLLQAQELLKQLHVYEAYKQPIGTYSSGMIKKVNLVLAFLGQPRLIMLDEPLITLDVEAVNVICEIIKDLRKKGTSFIITSHQTLPDNLLHFTGELVAEKKTINKINA